MLRPAFRHCRAAFDKGCFVGGGVEYSSTSIPGLFSEDRSTGCPEYRRTAITSESLASTCAPALPDPFGNINSRKMFTYTVEVELVYRFNWGGAPVAAKY